MNTTPDLPVAEHIAKYHAALLNGGVTTALADQIVLDAAAVIHREAISTANAFPLAKLHTA